MLKAAFALALALAALAALPGCEQQQAKTALSYTADAKRAYEEALKEFNAHNWIESQNLMREVKRKYSYSKYARLAELRIADADFEQDKFADAVRGYRQFVHDHRSDQEEVAYARSRIAESQYKEISESFLLPAGEERDQAVIMDAFKELRGFVHDYPDGKETPRIKELLSDVTARLVKHELYVARFYLQRDNYPAAVARIQYALRNFSGGISGPKGETQPDSGLEPEALLLLGETYLKMHRWNDARESFLTIVRRYTRSALTIQARGYLDYMKTRGV
jgi:outer membrane protein assembly factor BamD